MARPATAALRRKRRGRTIGLTLLAHRRSLIYPLIDHECPGRLQPATSSRCRFPDDTVVDVHDDLRDHGHRPEHRGRVRRVCSTSATSRSTRSAPTRAAFLASPHFGALGINLTFLGNVGPGAAGIHLPFWIIADRRGHRRRDVRRAARRTDPPAARRLPGDRDPRLRRDRAALLQEPLERHVLAQPGPDQHRAPERRTGPAASQGINPIDPPYLPFFDIIFDARSGPLARLPRHVPAAHRHRRRPQPRALAHRARLGRHPRGRDGGRDDGRQHGPDQAPRVRPRGQLRRRRRLVPGVLPRAPRPRTSSTSRSRSWS